MRHSVVAAALLTSVAPACNRHQAVDGDDSESGASDVGTGTDGDAGAMCGDGQVDPQEVCDDENDNPLDGCHLCAPSPQQVAAGFDHTCVVGGQGAVRCFGWGADGRLGTGDCIPEDVDSIACDVGDDEHPSSIEPVDVGESVVQIVTGGSHTCARLASGAVRCWGGVAGGPSPATGYPGSNAVGDDEAPSSAGDVDVGGPVLALAAGYNHTCAALDGGEVRCWGVNDDGQLGTGLPEAVGDDEPPASVQPLTFNLDIKGLYAGTNFSCVVVEGGQVSCWGANNSGQLGYGHADSVGDDESAMASPVDLGEPANQLALGSGHACALLADGRVRCWGHYISGKLGVPGIDENIGDDELPTSISTVELGGPAVQIAAGVSHSCAVLEDGAVRCWGRGGTGALGNGNDEDVGDDESPIDALPAGLGAPAASISVGQQYTCAVTSKAEVLCWGLEHHGRLGIPGGPVYIGDDEMPADVGPVDVF